MSPIPLGILASAGGQLDGFELIETAFGTGSASTITFSNIPQTYKHLEVRLSAIQASSSGTLYAYPNSDTSSIKPYYRINGNGSSVSPNRFTNQTSILLEGINSVTNSAMNTQIMTVYDYASTSKEKTFSQFIYDSNAHIIISNALWESSSAITSLSFTTSPLANFATTTRISLYGIRG